MLLWIPCEPSRYPFARLTLNITKIIGFSWMFIAMNLLVPSMIDMIIIPSVAGAFYSTYQVLLAYLSVITPLIWGITLAAGAEIIHSFLDCGDNSFENTDFKYDRNGD